MIIVYILEDFHIICINLQEKKRIKTQRGVYPMQDIKIDYLLNALCTALFIIIKSNLYKGS